MIIIEDIIDEISMGPFGSDIKVDNFVSEGVPVLNGSNINGIRLSENFSNFVTKEKAKSLKKANAKRGDIVVTHRGTLGQIAYIPENSNTEQYVISQSQFRVSLKRKLVDPAYFTYYFHTKEGQKRLLSFKSHVGVPALAQATSNFRKLEFPLIPLSEQLKIAKILSDLDLKIELNNKINAELEAIAKLLYDYWFVQFDFPDINGNPYKSSGGKMVYNEVLKKRIPDGWSNKLLSEIANITMGQSPSGSTFNTNGNGTVFYQGSTDFGWLFPKTRQYTTKPNRLATKGDILLSVRAPVGDINIANTDCCIGRGLAALNSKYGYDSYLFYVLKYFKRLFDLKNSEGTTFGSITKDGLFGLNVVYPTENVLNKYNTIVAKYNKLIFKNGLENLKLEKLRDWLLPMLMNRQVTLK